MQVVKIGGVFIEFSTIPRLNGGRVHHLFLDCCFSFCLCFFLFALVYVCVCVWPSLSPLLLDFESLVDQPCFAQRVAAAPCSEVRPCHNFFPNMDSSLWKSVLLLGHVWFGLVRLTVAAVVLPVPGVAFGWICCF